MSKLCRKGLLIIMIMILRHLKLHMLEICGKMPHICAAYFAKFLELWILTINLIVN